MTSPTRPWHHLSSEAKRELVKPLWQAGMSAAQIARQVGATRNAVIGVIHRMKQAGQAPASRQVPSNPQTSPSSDKPQEGKEAQKGTSDSEVRAEDSASPLRRSSGVSATHPYSPQAKPDSSHRAGKKSQAERARHEAAPVITISCASAFDPIPGIEPVPYGTVGCCKWSVDGFRGRGMLWCGAPNEPGSPWCASHLRLAYVPSQDRKEAA